MGFLIRDYCTIILELFCQIGYAHKKNPPDGELFVNDVSLLLVSRFAQLRIFVFL